MNKAQAAKPLLQGSAPWLEWQEYTSDGEYLGGPGSNLPSEWTKKYGWPAVGLSRTSIQLGLRDLVSQQGIPYHQGWCLKFIRQEEDEIVAINEQGQELSASFLVGCDGLKSMTRHVMLQSKGMADEPPNFTGIAVVS